MLDFRPHREKKVWGSVLHLFCDPHAAVSWLTVQAGYRCSLHYHRERANQFCVISGCLLIDRHFQGPDFPPNASELLRPGDMLVVPSGQWHRFSVLESGEVVEVYWPDTNGCVHHDDIIRYDEGGSFNLDEMKRLWLPQPILSSSE